ncbi:MAG: hypothetical protein ACLPVF_17990 [Acidimicrobiales bacterium]
MTAAHVVSPDDEQRHSPEGDDLWNESYYADFVHEDGTLGGWLRLGLYPNREVAWWTTWIVDTDRPGLCSVRYDAPVPSGTGLVSEDGAIRIAIEILEPLEQFRMIASAPAAILERPEAVYSGEPGVPARLDLDLTWTTDGTPYHYDLTTRYEIPCTVSGSVRIDGAERIIRGQGQRDHSWGVRDWWAFGWCWSSARLDDGTRVHLVHIRPPGFPVVFGYVQTPGGDVHPVTALTVDDQLGLQGMPTSARVELSFGNGADQGNGSATGTGTGSATSTSTGTGTSTDSDSGSDLSIEVTPLAFGPVLLRNDDGRTSRFPRAMVHYECRDGREGLGWMEWNQPDQD